MAVIHPARRTEMCRTRQIVLDWPHFFAKDTYLTENTMCVIANGV